MILPWLYNPSTLQLKFREKIFTHFWKFTLTNIKSLLCGRWWTKTIFLWLDFPTGISIGFVFFFSNLIKAQECILSYFQTESVLKCRLWFVKVTNIMLQHKCKAIKVCNCFMTYIERIIVHMWFAKTIPQFPKSIVYISCIFCRW